MVLHDGSQGRNHLLPEEFRAIREAGCEDVAACLGDDELVLKLRAPLAVLCDAGPSIGPCFVFVRPLVDHGLDGKDVSHLHDADGLVVGIVGDVGEAVEQLADAMAAVRLDHAESLGAGVPGDDVANLPILCTGLAVLYGLHEALVCGLDEELACLARRADDERLVQIAMIALIKDRDVNVDDIPVLQLPSVGDPVADDLVDRGAH